MTTISTSAASARESARQSDGRFGTQSHSEPDSLVQEVAEAQPYAGLKGPERIEAMKADLETAIVDLVESGRVAEYLDAARANGMARWSTNNRILVAHQVAMREALAGQEVFDRMSSIDARTYKQWEAAGRTVNKGEKAMWILAPNMRWVTETDEKTGKEKRKQVIAGFRGTAVFEAGQTDGDPIPEHPSTNFTGELAPGTYEGLLRYANSLGFTTREDEIADDPARLKGTLAYVSPTSKEVVVDSRLTDAEKAAAAAHEIGHIACGHLDDDEGYSGHVRGRKESEAEAFAYMMLRERGASPTEAEAFSPGYIASWAGGDHKTIARALDKATRAFHTAIDTIDWKDQDQ